MSTIKYNVGLAMTKATCVGTVLESYSCTLVNVFIIRQLDLIVQIVSRISKHQE